MNGTIPDINDNERRIIVEELRLPQTIEYDGAQLKRILMKENMTHISTSQIEKANRWIDNEILLFKYLSNLVCGFNS
jgi:hypothetical protein